MEFICVLSVGGSLASYFVQTVGENRYKAVLKPNNGKRDDVPAEIRMEKTNGEWLAEPWHDDIVPSLTHAIETGGKC